MQMHICTSACIVSLCNILFYDCLLLIFFTTMRLAAVRKIGVSQHCDGSIKAPLKPLDHHCGMVLRGLKGAFDWAPVMPRDVSTWTTDVFFFSVALS